MTFELSIWEIVLVGLVSGIVFFGGGFVAGVWARKAQEGDLWGTAWYEGYQSGLRPEYDEEGVKMVKGKCAKNQHFFNIWPNLCDCTGAFSTERGLMPEEAAAMGVTPYIPDDRPLSPEEARLMSLKCDELNAQQSKVG
ncbi:MAG: hypothetical protein M3P06_11595 [Acidobacteriota bacterium]|nr:hypothetical protein [Acidobacteriota bacterium]